MNESIEERPNRPSAFAAGLKSFAATAKEFRRPGRLAGLIAASESSPAVKSEIQKLLSETTDKK